MSVQRIVVLGDPHIAPQDAALWREEIIPDIDALSPDLVLVVGDLSGDPGAGTTENSRQAAAILSGLRAPWASIIGNHDLQSPEFATDDEAVAMMLNTLGRPRPGFVIERERFAVIGLDNTFWRRNTVNKNEIVFDDAQLAWWRGELARLQDKPIIMLGHAPPIGSGVMVMPELHARVGNAYANQNHEAGRIQQIIWEHPTVLFWFSGHNHLGQHYRDALCRRLGVVYAHTGTASRLASRDACRHSRILEIGADSFRVRTFDHDLRAVDPALDHDYPQALETAVAWRRQMLGRRFVPSDPATMEQGSGEAVRPPSVRRFVFLSDAHISLPVPPVTKRVIAWCARRVRALAPDRLILGGDLTHRPVAAQAEAFLEILGAGDVPMDYLPGNNEGREFALPSPEVIRGCVAREPGVFLLATSDAEEAGEAVDRLLEALPRGGGVLVFAHFPPELAGEERCAKLAEGDVAIHWICGHRHTALESSRGNLQVHVCGGLDALKARGSRPELLCVDWDGQAAVIGRHPVPERFIASPGPSAGRFPVGVAFRGTAEEILRTAIERGIKAVQFHYRHSRDEPSRDEGDLARTYREAVPGAFLSLHLPNFPHPDAGPDLADQEPWLRWAEGMGLDDLTIHLPDVTASYLFSHDGSMQDSAWARGCLSTYVGLAKRALGMGAQISFENVYNKRVNAPGEERLSSQPWHLLRFVERVRDELRKEGLAEGEVRRVGIIFDAGHAFADVHFSKFHGLADWLGRVSPYVQLAHIHQVVRQADGRSVNHQPIGALRGPQINYEGFLAALADAVKRPFPLLVEVRGREEALLSWETLTKWTGPKSPVGSTRRAAEARH